MTAFRSEKNIYKKDGEELCHKQDKYLGTYSNNGNKKKTGKENILKKATTYRDVCWKDNVTNDIQTFLKNVLSKQKMKVINILWKPTLLLKTSDNSKEAPWHYKITVAIIAL